MISFRSLTRIALAVGALALTLPAAAGSLSPQLRALADAYHKAPQATVTRAARATTASAPRIFAPHVSAAGKVQVYMHYRAGELPAAAALAHLGATGVLVSRPLGVVQAWLPIAKLQSAAALDGVTSLSLPVYGMVKAPAGSRPAAGTCAAVPSGLAIDNEGIAAENVAPVHEQGITGAGVKVGIISDGVDCLAVSQDAGYLPNGVWVNPDLGGSGDEGTALLEEVHAMAPDATLGFCGPGTTAEFLQCLDDFATWGAGVISDDLGFFPIAYNLDFFATTDGGNGIVEFAQQNPGTTLATSAGNDRSDYFEGAYKANTDPNIISLDPVYTVPPATGGAAGRTYQSAMDFGLGAGKSTDAVEKVLIGNGNTLFADLTWNDPADGPYDDLDMFLVKNDGTVVASSTWDQEDHPSDPNDPAHYPLEFINYTNSSGGNQTLYLGVLCFSCANATQPGFSFKLYGFMNGGGTFNYVTNGGISGHSALGVEVTTAAAHYNGHGVSSTIESFSNTGPYTYGDWVNGSSTRDKPDITGTDGVTVSGAGGFSSPFFGTSAASPNVGAVIALVRGAFPTAEPDAAAWKQLVMDTANAGALTNYSVNAGGAGLIDAEAAAASLSGTITATIVAPVATSGSAVKVNPDTDVAFAATCEASDDQTLSYNWAFGGNSGIPDSEQLIPDPVQYANGGIYTAVFTCSDPIVSDTDQVTIAVQAAAAADDQSISTAFETPITGQFAGSGIGGEQVNYEIAQQPAHGTLQVNGTTSFVYAPDMGYSGGDAFKFDIDNGVMTSNTATVSVTVGAAPPPPTPPPGGGGGGGALGGAGLILLAGLALFMRRKR